MAISDRPMSVLLIPASADCNRGDQALVWTAIDLLRERIGVDSQIGLLTEAAEPESDPQCRQTYARGFPYFRMILENPNRVLKGKAGPTRHRRWDFVRVAGCAAVDLLRSLWILLFARMPTLVMPLLNAAQRDTYKRYQNADLIVFKGGGFIYAHRRPMYYYFIWFALYHLMLAHRLGKPAIILPNSFGPFETRFSRMLVRHVLKRCSLVLTREAKSQQLLEEVVPGVARQYPDMAFMLSVDETERAWGKAELQHHGVDVSERAVGFTMRPWRFPGHPDPAGAYDSYISAMAQLVRHVHQRGYQPVFFAHVQGPGLHETDRIALDDCQKQLSDIPIAIIDGPYNCCQMRAMYSHLGYMVGTRFHSCIFAISESVPTLALSYQGNKAPGIMREIGLERFAVDIAAVSVEVLHQLFDELSARREEIKERCQAYMNTLSMRWTELGSELDGVLSEKALGNR